MTQDRYWELFWKTGLPQAYSAAKGEQRRQQWLNSRIREVRDTFHDPQPPQGLH